MDFPQLLSSLAHEHRSLEQHRDRLSEEVSWLRKELSGLWERGRAQGGVPGQLPPASPHGADGDGGGADQGAVLTVRALAARQLSSRAGETADLHAEYFVSVGVGAGPRTTTPLRRGLDAAWPGFAVGLRVQAQEGTLELRVLESRGEDRPPRSVGSVWVPFRSLPPGRWERRAEALPSGGGLLDLLEFEVMWQPGEGGGSAPILGVGGERAAPAVAPAECPAPGGGERGAQGHVRAQRGSLLWESDLVDEREHLSRARQTERFLDMFGLSESQGHTYTVTAENLKPVLAKRGLRNTKDRFLEKALQELIRVSPHRRSIGTKTEGCASGRFSGILSTRLSSRLQNPQFGISFEAFVSAILMPDLPKQVDPTISRGIDKMQEALLKQDVEEVIAKLSRKRAAMTVDLDTHNPARKTKAAWKSRIEAVLNVTVAITVITSIVCLGASTETDPDWEGWVVLEVFFAGILVTDSVLRIVLCGWGTFWCGQERYWNWLDIALTVVSVGDVCVTLAAQAEDVALSRLSLVVRSLRVMRLARLLKIMRSPMIRELTNMLVGFALGSPALFWVSIILWVVVALLALALRVVIGPAPGEDVLIAKCGRADGVNAMVGTDPDCEAHKLYAEMLLFLGSLNTCMFTVFRCMIGDCTSSAGSSLPAHLSRGYGAKFDLVYLTGMIVMIFGLFNVMSHRFAEGTATMVGLKYNETKQKLRSVYEHKYVKRKLRELVRRIQCVSKHVQQGKSKAIRDNGRDGNWGDISPRSPLATSLPSVFRNHDVSEVPDDDPDSVASIHLTEDEFFAVIEDSVIQRILLQLDVEVEGAGREALFEIMDPNYAGTVDVASMIDTLMRLRGGPMKVDMIAPSVAIRGLQQELRRLGSGLANLAVTDRAAGGAGDTPKISPKSTRKTRLSTDRIR
ncbi:unnamed protein product [Prorocentrum cordatum]|uniref:Ion transport domain-containing protein n=1 Tax=Prorocentrum cordatum TaxID=2364126 RepID=A0ABN9W6L9_9DINO|nr:unnamed protein product [Polarella glacialis]